MSIFLLVSVLTSVAAYESFYDALPQMTDWGRYMNASVMDRVDLEEVFLQNVAPYLAAEPLTPIDHICQPPSLPPVTQEMCLREPHAGFTELRDKPVKVAQHFYFGYDLDLLEIQLRENFDTVDYFFLTEALHAHRSQPRLRRKPLMWERAKFQHRFRPYLHKVVHFILDESDVPKLSGSSMWTMEVLQWKTGWQKFLKWNAATQYFGPEDIMLMGMADEVPSRRSVHLLKHCLFKSPVDVGSLMYMCTIKEGFRSDFPVRGHPYTLGNPTAYHLGEVGSETPYGRKGTSPHFILGGSHLTTNQYLPYLMVKLLSASEYINVGLDYVVRVIEDEIRAPPPNQCDNVKHRLIPLTQLQQSHAGAIQIPWFMTCNPDRFAVWFGKPDSRLDRKVADYV